MTVLRRELQRAKNDTAPHRYAFSFQAAGVLVLWLAVSFLETRAILLASGSFLARRAVFSAVELFLLFPLLAGLLRSVGTGNRGEGLFWFTDVPHLLGAALCGLAMSGELLLANGIWYALLEIVRVASALHFPTWMHIAESAVILLWGIGVCLMLLQRLSALAQAAAFDSLPRAYFFFRLRPLPFFCCLRIFLQGIVLVGASLFLPVLPRNFVTFCALLFPSPAGAVQPSAQTGDTLEFEPAVCREISEKIQKTLDKPESV